MKILFVHQNFPAQFKHLAPALLQAGHEINALAINKNPVPKGIRVHYHTPKRSSTPKIHPWVGDIESKVIRGESAFYAALEMRKKGYIPDIIIAHPGWGESLFLKDVWPTAKLGLFAEFYYQSQGSDVDFDKEFAKPVASDVCRLRLKNASQDLQFHQADGLISPTNFQCSTFPPSLQEKITVIHDGIDTQVLRSNDNAELRLNNEIILNKDSEVITFVNRNLEPMRGYHIFMRSLPEVLKQRPNARVIIVGGDEISYGAKAPDNKSWKQVFLEEVRDQLDMSRVHFVGKIAYPNFIKLLQVSTVHVYLTYPFVLSWSLLEAMSIGCAIVASDTAPIKEVITHNQTGRLVDFFDVEHLAGQIIDLLNNPAERKKLGHAARGYILSNYDLQTSCLPKQIAWVDELLNDK